MDRRLMMKTKAIKNERCVRECFRDHLIEEENLFFIEHGMGGTDGLPDVMVPWVVNGVPSMIFCELKVGEVVRNELRFTVRQAQKRVTGTLYGWEFVMLFIVGESGGTGLWFVDRGLNGAADGRVAADSAPRIPSLWDPAEFKRALFNPDFLNLS
jgi:hypothetical protein